MAMSSSTGGQFATTRWSVVFAAGRELGAEGSQSRRALEELCGGYWYPLYAYVRRNGHRPEDAADLVQGFFVSLLERNDLAAVDPARGRFRAFLLACFDHFIANRARHDRAQKRGGGKVLAGLDFEEGERRYVLEPAHELTPQRVYERRWALSVIDAAMAKLRGEYEARGKGAVFEALSDLIAGTAEEGYAAAGRKVGMSEGAVKVAVHRLRKRCRELLREEVRQTVADEADVDDELAHLLASL